MRQRLDVDVESFEQVGGRNEVAVLYVGVFIYLWQSLYVEDRAFLGNQR